jgi:CRP-like cAMP-binding protein
MADIQCNCERCELKSMFLVNITSDEAQSICMFKTERKISKGETIIRQGEQIREFIYLKEGLVKLYRQGTTGREQIISIAKPFDFVSLLSTFSSPVYNYSVATLEDSVTCNIDLDLVKGILLKNGPFAMSVIEKMSKATDNIIISFLEIKQRQLYGRVAYIILFLADNVYFRDSFDLPLSRKEIAELIGMTTENVIRAMSSLRQDKIIRINGKSIDILEKDRLIKILESS